MKGRYQQVINKLISFRLPRRRETSPQGTAVSRAKRNAAEKNAIDTTYSKKNKPLHKISDVTPEKKHSKNPPFFVNISLTEALRI
jgi:hypothetical protein